MYQLVYVSSAAVPFDSQSLAELLQEARENNHKDDVTGMLLYHDGNFFQVLEGPEDNVRRVYDRVAKDDRHQGVTTIYEEEADERAFSDWSMAWCEVSDRTLRDIPGFSDLMLRRNPDDSFGPDPQTVHQMILTFREHAR